MGNAGSSNMPRERHKSNDMPSIPNSPFRELSIRESVDIGEGHEDGGGGGGATTGSAADSAVGGGGGGGSIDSDVITGSAVPVAFNFDKKCIAMHGGGVGLSQEDDETAYEPYYTKAIGRYVQQQQQQQHLKRGTEIIESNCEFSILRTRKRSSIDEDSEEMATTAIEADTDIESETIKQKHKNDDDGGDGSGENSGGASASVGGGDSIGHNNEKSENVLSSSSTASSSKTPALPTVLRWDGGGKNVMISGTFTKWKPIPMVRSHGNFVTIIDLPEGDHQYKFCVDGEWRHDPKMKSVENDNGDTNNLVTVRQSDFEVFQALAKDGEQSANHSEKEYSQEVPQIRPWEKVAGPPILPPHLLQVILNKDTPLSCEPTLLPEPNHVMLNHLYALSIKDGVMVLSATHRYRKKYVTTLLYKPI